MPVYPEVIDIPAMSILVSISELTAEESLNMAVFPEPGTVPPSQLEPVFQPVEVPPIHMNALEVANNHLMLLPPSMTVGSEYSFIIVEAVLRESVTVM